MTRLECQEDARKQGAVARFERDPERGAVHPDLCVALAVAGAVLTVLVLVARG